MRDVVPHESSADDVWPLEIRRMYQRAFKARFVGLPIAGCLFVAFCIWDPVPWKLVWMGINAVAICTLTVAEYLRHRVSPPTPVSAFVNYSATMLILTSVLYLTGGIESPLILPFAVMGIVSGFLAGSPVRALPVIGIPLSVVLFFAIAATTRFVPRVSPAFFSLGDGYWHATPYVWIKSGLLWFAIIAGSRFGAIARQALEARTREAMQARREALETLVARNRELLSVSTTIAHELKNPLASIQGLAQLMARNGAAASAGKDRERLEVMRREIGRMAQTLEELRNFTRPLSDLSLRRVNLSRLVDDVCVLSEGMAHERGTQLVVSAEAPVEIVCDPQKVKQALLNLLHNSLEATARGDRIEVTVEKRQDHICTVVRDTGHGIPADVAGRLFTPGSTTKENGSGIGLVVARAIAEQHGGSLSLDNLDGGGCAATLALPPEPPAAAPAAGVSP